MFRTYLSGAVLLAALALVAGVQAEQDKKPDKKAAFTDPEKAGVEFQYQGEYEGTLGAAKIGCQVIALGDDKYEANFLPGGLPGGGWDGKTKFRVATDPKISSTERDTTGLFGGGWKATIKLGSPATLSGTNDKGDKLDLKRIVRKSTTEGAAPPQGALVLFDGKNVSEWNGGKLDGDLLYCGTTTKKKFKDFTLHVEFRTPFQPYARGQGRGNSGVYLVGKHEIQVLDSFGLKGQNNECGGIYGSVAPSVNMCYPPLSWQTYDIDYKAGRTEGDKKVKPRVTVRHNGVVIHDNVEIKDGNDQAGPINLQNHGNPVHFRNIWIVEHK